MGRVHDVDVDGTVRDDPMIPELNVSAGRICVFVIYFMMLSRPGYLIRSCLLPMDFLLSSS